MIPRKIHYCWFGRGEMPELARRCIASWKKYCPDYEIIEWNEDSFDVNQNLYTRICYEQRKFAFLTDYVRLKVLLENGGIYFDTDVEVLKPFDSLLDQAAFFGFESDLFVNTGLGFGCEARNQLVKAMLAEYDPMLDGEHEMISCPALNTRALVKYGLQLNGQKQKIQGATVYPAEWFNPYDDPTGRLLKTKNTYSVHWYAKSWLSKGAILRSNLTRPIHRLFGTDIFRKLHLKT